MNTTDLTCYFLGAVHWKQTGQDITSASIIACVLSSIFALTAALGNGTIMLVIWKTRELHSPSLTLLFSLAVADLLVGLIGQPSFVAFKIAELLGNFKVYCTLRMIQFFFGWITCSVSFVILSGICIDRLLALTLHLRYQNIVTVPRVVRVCVVVWVFCSAWTVSKIWLGDTWIILPAIIAVFAILLTAFCTLKIFHIARKHLRQINNQSEAMAHIQKRAVDVLKCKKSAATVIYVYGFLVVFYLPFLVVMVVESVYGVTRSVKIAYDLATTAVFINSSVNPVIYCWRMSQIRQAVRNYVKNLLIVGRH